MAASTSWSYRTDWPRPDPGPGEVLIKVGACGLNNTDINTREGWYSKAVTGATGSTPTRRGARRRGPVLGRRAHRLSAHPGGGRLRADRGRRFGVDPPGSASASSPTTGCAIPTT
jgi:hypothetical protein